MKKTILLFLCLLLALPALSQAQAIDGEALALETLADLAAGDYAAVFASCDEAMREALGGEDGVAQLWAQLEMAFGAFETVETATCSAQSGYLVVLAQCVFATSDVTLQLAYDSDGAFAGLSVAFFAAKENTQELPGETVLLREGAQDETPQRCSCRKAKGRSPASSLCTAPARRIRTFPPTAPPLSLTWRKGLPSVELPPSVTINTPTRTRSCA